MVARGHQYERRDNQDLDRPRPVGPLVFGATAQDGYWWAASHVLGGSPFQRSRRTTVTREGRPLRHAQGTHESVYVLPDRHVRNAAQEVIEVGALEALDQARVVVFAGHVADRPGPDHQETAVAECEDEATSPWPAPDGGCGADFLARFRRTLAWHIARQPGGLIALAIRYGHLHTVLDARTSSGYASRSRHGIHSVLDIETALAASDTAARLRDRAAAGENISGPAARRALTAAAQIPRFKGRIVSNTFVRKASAFLARDGVVLFDNPDAFLICAFKRENALCEPDPDANAPRQYDCRPGCGNAVRTDTHARLLRERAGEIYQLAAHAPEPVGRRMRANADRLRETAETHDATAHRAEAWA